MSARPPANEFGGLEQLEVILDAVFASVLVDDPSGFGLGVGAKQQIFAEHPAPLLHFVGSVDRELASLATKGDAFFVMALLEEAGDPCRNPLGPAFIGVPFIEDLSP